MIGMDPVDLDPGVMARIAFGADPNGHRQAVRTALDAWFAEAKAARWSNTADVRNR
jgi:hypothetical protein